MTDLHGNLADASGKARWGKHLPQVDFISGNDGKAFADTVGQSQRTNPFGLSDTLGNVYEWYRDGYRADFYTLVPDVAVDPENIEPSQGAILRGGTWSHGPQAVRSANRHQVFPHNRFCDVGFRVARSEGEWSSSSVP